MRIHVLGGTGFAGGHTVAEAAARGHEVVSFSRHVPDRKVQGVAYREADVLDPATLAEATEGADAVVSAIAPRGALEGRTRPALADLAGHCAQKGVRLGVIGGAGSLRVSEDGPLVMDTPDFPAEILAEVKEMAGVLEDLRAADQRLDWFYLSPAGGFGGFDPGERTGTYRLGGEVLVTDEDGRSYISGADLALALVDELEAPRHRQARFTVGY
ncbi:NAD(P)-dependent oxidoreductase [Brevibacterium litoralis]|uniref:NAD(P)-dependent oxidoreductase n=1 Tax=Brevibacterium litoralis TaxID=3138935 RepID=UPI0032ECABEB